MRLLPLRCRMELLHTVETILAMHGETYLVGSANWGLATRVIDHDYVTRADPVRVGSVVAETLRGKMIVLDVTRRYVRIVAPRIKPVDLAPLSGGTISTDLARRDFTVNAMASMLPRDGSVLDPFRGRIDLRYRILRCVSSAAVTDDPLRILRGIRLVAEHGFLLSEETIDLMRAGTGLMRCVSPERIRSELLRALRGEGWSVAAELLLVMQIWQNFPVVPDLVPDPESYLYMIRSVKRLAPVLPERCSHLWERSNLLDDLPICVIAAAFIASHIEATDCERMARQMRLARKEVLCLESIMRAYASLEHARDAGSLFAVADRYGLAAVWAAVLLGDELVLNRMLELQQVSPSFLPKGDQLAAALSMPPGPWVGKVLVELRKAAALGKIHDQSGAIDLARAIVSRPGTEDTALSEENGEC